MNKFFYLLVFLFFLTSLKGLAEEKNEKMVKIVYLVEDISVINHILSELLVLQPRGNIKNYSPSFFYEEIENHKPLLSKEGQIIMNYIKYSFITDFDKKNKKLNFIEAEDYYDDLFGSIAKLQAYLWHVMSIVAEGIDDSNVKGVK